MSVSAACTRGDGARQLVVILAGFRARERCAAAWLALALLAPTGPGICSSEVRVTSTQSVGLDSPHDAGRTPYALSLVAHAFEGSRWSHSEIVGAMREAAKLLGQCGVALVQAELRVIDAPRRFHFYSTPVSREFLRRFPVPRPALFFVEDTKNRPAYDAEAIGRSNSATRPELADTVWIAYGARDLPQVLAHELVHVLSDSGEHSEAPDNLMRAETLPGNVRLTGAQCERVREHGAANGLLTR